MAPAAPQTTSPIRSTGPLVTISTPGPRVVCLAVLFCFCLLPPVFSVASPQTPTVTRTLDLLLATARDEFSRSEFDKSLAAAVAAESVAVTARDARARAFALRYQGWVHGWLGFRDLQLRCLNGALRLWEDLGDEREAAEERRQLGAQIYRTLEPQRAQELVSGALSVFRKRGDAEGMTDALRSQGQLYWDRQKYDSALAAYEEGMGIARTHQMPLAYARLAGNLSYVFMRQRSYERMRDTLQGVLAEFRKAGIVHEIADAEIDLALAYRELHDYGMSIALAEQGLATAQAKGLRSRERFALGLLADTYELQGDIRTANRYRKEISVHMQEATEDQLRRYYYAVEALDASEHRNQLARWQLLRLEETRRLALVVLAASAVVIVLLSLRFIHKRRTARVLQAQSHLIAEQNDTLGRQVQALDAARTELRTLNESLEAQVRNRTAALQLESDEHRRTAEELTRSLREKEVLLREIHHRVKNNLQVMSSLLNLQAGKIPDPEERRPFLESIGRIRSMALVHEVLYQTSDFAQLDFASYLERLVRLLQSAYAAPEVQSRLRLEKVHLPLDLAVPCALIVNELVSNAFKHAFPDGRKGVVTTAVRVLEDGKTELSVEDNGIGIPPEAMRNDGKSLGMFLVRILTDQILGTLTLDQSHGTTFRIQFPPEQE